LRGSVLTPGDGATLPPLPALALVSPERGDDIAALTNDDRPMPTQPRTRTPEDTVRSVLVISGLVLLIIGPMIRAVRGRLLRVRVNTNHLRSRGRLWLDSPGSATAAVGEILIDAADTH
jgi:hypothetical protein